MALLVSGLLVAAAVLGSLAGLSALVRKTPTWIRIASPAGLLVVIAVLLSVSNSIFGFSVRDVHECIRDWLQFRIYRLASGKAPAPKEEPASPLS